MEHKFKKKFGQNFLMDKNVINKIINFFNLDKNDLVIEIGPGAGAITTELSNRCNVLAYEVDLDLKKQLTKLESKSNVRIIWDDFLKRNVREDLKKTAFKNIYVIANLPYYITTPIIQKLINEKIEIEGMLLMVQKEVGDRFSALPGSRQYGSLSVFLNYYFEIHKEFVVTKNCFYPKPEVDSVIVSFKTISEKKIVKNKELLFRLIRDSFQHKRKTLKNNLKNYNLLLIEQVLNNHNMDLSIRAEQISLDIFIEIANIL